MGLEKTWLKPPPLKVQPTSVCVGLALHLNTGPTNSVRGWVAVACGSVHRYVPPTPVTSGSLAGHSTVGNGNVTGFVTGVFLLLAEPPSPDDPRTVTPLAAAEIYAWRRFRSDCVLLKASSAEAKLCEITVARWWSMTYCSAFIMSGKPCTPSVSAVGVVTSKMFAIGAVACAISTSSATSSAHSV